jgi:hypothetical protein
VFTVATHILVQVVTGLLTTLLSSGNTPGMAYGAQKFRIRGGVCVFIGGGGGDFLGQFNCLKMKTRKR